MVTGIGEVPIKCWLTLLLPRSAVVNDDLYARNAFHSVYKLAANYYYYYYYEYEPTEGPIVSVKTRGIWNKIQISFISIILTITTMR